MQIERIAFCFRERRAFVVAGMIQEGKTKQLRPDHRFRHGSCLMFSLSGDTLSTKPTTVNTQNERHADPSCTALCAPGSSPSS